tara:strand:+ start:537 stop:1103 length:567 start_codon:yes stop_codon:yes gene_type:complete
LRNQLRFNHRKKNFDGLVINEMIRHPQLRVTDPDGKTDIMDKKTAMDLAKELGKDLILITDKADPPVAKILDKNKFLYEKKQREKEQKKKQRESEVEEKEVRMGLNIDEGDINTKVNNIKKWLAKNNNLKVKLTIQLRGRERGKVNMAHDLLRKFADRLECDLEKITQSGGRVSTKLKEKDAISKNEK